mgnify:CR=1 FL=1
MRIPTDMLGVPAIIGAPSDEFGAWVRLVLLCERDYPDGFIPDVSGCTSRAWLALCGVDKEIVDRESQLWEWRGDDLFVCYFNDLIIANEEDLL